MWSEVDTILREFTNQVFPGPQWTPLSDMDADQAKTKRGLRS